MPIVTGKDVAKSYGAQDVLLGIDFQIDAGDRTALVGPNGEGKSTILRLIVGLETPSAGQLVLQRGLRIGYLPQQAPEPKGRTLYLNALAVFSDLQAMQAELEALEAAMADPARHEEAMEQYGVRQQAFELAGGYTYEYEVRRVLEGIGFTPEDFDKPLRVLSGGQQTRALLAELLLQKPDLLLLDEPTNHLDLAATEWLEGYLSEWKGSVVVVAHDRYFLDRVANKVWDLANGKLELYRGNYTHYVEQKAERIEQRRAEYEAQQAQIERTEAFIRRYKAGQRAKEARGRLKKLGHLERVERPQEKQTLKLALQSTGRSGELVLRTRELKIGYGTARGRKVLFSVPDLTLKRLSRAALIGPNGSGKTTFLRTVVGELPAMAGTVRLGESLKPGYFSQSHDDLQLTRSPLDEILSVKNIPVSQGRSFLSRFLFFGDDVFKPLANLSGGERSRVKLAKLTLGGANFLILDEPTNHLDIASREVLEEVLLDFEGTLLFVSHDRYLVDALATEVWAIEGDRLQVYDGNYTAYLEQRRAAAAQQDTKQVGPPAGGNGGARAQDERQEQRRREQAQRKALEQAGELERTVHELEGRLAELVRELEAASRDGRLDDVRDLGTEYSRLESERDRTMSAWLELVGEHGA